MRMIPTPSGTGSAATWRSTVVISGDIRTATAATADVDRAPDIDPALALRDAALPPARIGRIPQALLIVVGVALSLWLLYELAVVVYVLILAALLAYVIAPLVRMAEHPIRLGGRRRHLPRGLAIGVVYLFMAGSVSAAAALLLPAATAQAADMIASAPAYAQSIATWEHGWSRYYERLRMPIELRQAIDQSLLAAHATAVTSGRGIVIAFMRVVSDLPWVVLIPILAFFLLKDATSFRRAIVVALPHRIQLRGHRLFEEMNATLAAYVRAQLLACVLVGVLSGIGFAVIGIPYAVLLGVLAAVLEFIPLVGPLLLAATAAIVGALHAPLLALWAIGFLAVLRIVQDYVIYPRLIRRGVALHPLGVILAVLAGATLAGVAGMFLAVPCVAVGAVAFRHWFEWREAAVVHENGSA